MKQPPFVPMVVEIRARWQIFMEGRTGSIGKQAPNAFGDQGSDNAAANRLVHSETETVVALGLTGAGWG